MASNNILAWSPPTVAAWIDLIGFSGLKSAVLRASGKVLLAINLIFGLLGLISVLAAAYHSYWTTTPVDDTR